MGPRAGLDGCQKFCLHRDFFFFKLPPFIYLGTTAYRGSYETVLQSQSLKLGLIVSSIFRLSIG